MNDEYDDCEMEQKACEMLPRKAQGNPESQHRYTNKDISVAEIQEATNQGHENGPPGENRKFDGK
jgi:hypothetical protein